MYERVIHRFQGFETIEEAKAFGKGVLLTPKSRGDRRIERLVIGEQLDLEKFPYIRVWNETI